MIAASISSFFGLLARVGEHAAEALVRVGADGGEVLAVLLPDVGEVGLHHVAEDDRVADLHHRGLEVHREQDALLLGVGDLRGEERLQRRLAHDGGVDDLAGQHGEALEVGASSPSAAACRIVSVVGAGTVTDVSECRKSPSLIVETWLLVSGLQAPMECGCFWA